MSHDPDRWVWVHDLQQGDSRALLASMTPKRAVVLVTEPAYRPGTWTLGLHQVTERSSRYRVCWVTPSPHPTTECALHYPAVRNLIETVTDAAYLRALKRGPVADIWPGTAQYTDATTPEVSPDAR